MNFYFPSATIWHPLCGSYMQLCSNALNNCLEILNQRTVLGTKAQRRMCKNIFISLPFQYGGWFVSILDLLKAHR